MTNSNSVSVPLCDSFVSSVVIRKSHREMLLDFRHRTDIPAFVRERLRFPLEPAQESLLQTTGPRVILNCTRQWGKSTMAACVALHRAYNRPNSLVLIVSPTQRQSTELIKKIRELVFRLGIEPQGGATSLCLPNRSRIEALPGIERNIRGFSSANLILIDEAARVGDELYRAVRPMLANVKGDLWLMSTPYGKQGFFFHSWSDASLHWTRVSVKASDCPRFTPEFLEEERIVQGDSWFRQEYMCEFMESETNIFTYEEIQRAFTTKEIQWNLL